MFFFPGKFKFLDKKNPKKNICLTFHMTEHFFLS